MGNCCVPTQNNNNLVLDLGYREVRQGNQVQEVRQGTQVIISYVFAARKGLIETHLMPYLGIEDKVLKLP